MKCRCGADTQVTDSRAGAFDTIRRRRVCVACGGRFTTFESRIAPWVVEKHRASKAAKQKRRWHERSEAERRAIKKREHTRAAARTEAKATGRPVAEIYQEWGCE